MLIPPGEPGDAKRGRKRPEEPEEPKDGKDGKDLTMEKILKIILKIEDGESNDGEGKMVKGVKLCTRYENMIPDTS